MIAQTVRILNNTTSYELFYSGNCFNNLELQEYSSLPSWVVPYYGVSPYIQFLTFNPTVVGTYNLFFTQGTSPPSAFALLVVEVVDSLTEPLDTCNNSEAICINWITREGGRASYIFDQRKNFSVTAGDSKTFDNSGYVRFYQRGKNFDAKTVYKTGLTDNEIDLISSLRTSIQAWEYNETTGVSSPILLNADSFDLYSTKSKLNEITVKYRMANYKEIQSQ